MTEMITKLGRHPVQVISGDADGIRARGEEIENLGEQMIGAAALLKEIKDGITVEKGLSIERIQREVSNTHEELHLAGERYKPTGTAMKQYAEALSQVQTRMRTLVTDIADNEAARAAAQLQLTTAQELEAQASSEYDPSDQTTVSRYWNARSETQDARTHLANCESTLDTSMGEFDQQWDTWDVAYETAVSQVGDATTGGVTDRWRDKAADVIEIIVEVAGYIGIALVIASFFVAGPILAVIATILAIVALAGTLTLFFSDRANMTDVAWATVGVLPFGKLVKVLKPGERLQGLKILPDLKSVFLRVPMIKQGQNAVHWTNGHGLYDAAEFAAMPAKLDIFKPFTRINYWDDFMRRMRTGMDQWDAQTFTTLRNGDRVMNGNLQASLELYIECGPGSASTQQALNVIRAAYSGTPGTTSVPFAVAEVAINEVLGFASATRDAVGGAIDLFSGNSANIEQWQAELRG